MAGEADRRTREMLAQEVADRWREFDQDGTWMQGDPFPPDLENTLDRLAVAYPAPESPEEVEPPR